MKAKGKALIGDLGRAEWAGGRVTETEGAVVVSVGQGGRDTAQTRNSTVSSGLTPEATAFECKRQAFFKSETFFFDFSPQCHLLQGGSVRTYLHTEI